VLEPPKGKTPEDWEPRPQTLFRATDFGDDVDRPLRKSDGSWTYFASDIAYHWDKVKRGYANLIDVMGADHGGYVKRMQAATKAISGGEASRDGREDFVVSHLGSPAALRKADFSRLTDESELALIRTMGNWPRTVESAAEAHEPHRLAFYLYDLASEFHTLWTKGKEDVSLRFIVETDPALTAARLALALGVRTVIASGLGIFGVQPVEELR